MDRKTVWKWIKTHAPGAWRSWTIRFAAFLAVAPEVVPILQQNFEELKPFIPDALESRTMQALALAVVLLRIRTRTSLTEKGTK